eukprot:4068869-Pleurochrysis_carterae.AAC.1
MLMRARGEPETLKQLRSMSAMSSGLASADKITCAARQNDPSEKMRGIQWTQRQRHAARLGRSLQGLQRMEARAMKTLPGALGEPLRSRAHRTVWRTRIAWPSRL